MRIEGHVCLEMEANGGYFMIDKIFKDESSVYSEDVIVDEDVKACL